MFNLTHSTIYRLIIVTISLLLISCQSTMSAKNNIPINSSLYLDNKFPHYQTYAIESEDDVFALDQVMLDMISEELLTIKDNKRRAQQLLKQLFSKENIDLAYQSSANLTAREAYHSKTANCMSLTIMAYAIAKEANFNVKFQNIKVPEYWVRHGQYNMLTGHVNLVLTQPSMPNKMIVYGQEILQIDFDPALYKNSFAKHIIDKNTVLAMFYNNKGADALVDRQYELAYAYLKQATQIAPSFSAAWGNLGILYKLTDHFDKATEAYQYAISLDHDNLTAMGNLAFLLKRQGNIEQAQHLDNILHNKRIKNPYYHALLADEAFYRGNNDQALQHYKKAIRMKSKVHEFHFGIAKVYYALNKLDKAENAMRKAISYNKASAIESQYIAKLNFLKQADASE